MTLVLGMDVGGTSSRALVADLTGRVLGIGRGGGGNPVSRGIGLQSMADRLEALPPAPPPAPMAEPPDHEAEGTEPSDTSPSGSGDGSEAGASDHA